MSNPSSQAAPNASLPAEAALPTTPSGKSPRKGPRRATAPAGAPSKAASPVPSLLVLGADGMVVPTPSVEGADHGTSPSTTDDAGHSSVAAPLPPAEVEISDQEPVSTDSTNEASDSAADTDPSEEPEAASEEEPAKERSNDAPTEADDVEAATAEDSPIETSAEPSDESISSEMIETSPVDDDSEEGTESADPAKADEAESVPAEESPSEPSAETASDTESSEEESGSDGNEAALVEQSSADSPAEPTDAADLPVPETSHAALRVAATAEDASDTPSEPGTEDTTGGTEESPVQGSGEDTSTEEASDTPAESDIEADADADADETQASPLDAVAKEESAPKENEESPVEESSAQPADAAGLEASEESTSETPSELTDEQATEEESVVEAVEKPSPVDAAESPDTVDSEVAPTSRRERRMAEQKLNSGTNPADAVPTVRASATGAEAVVGLPPTISETQTSPQPEKKHRKRPLAFLKGLLFMVVIAAIVVGTGTVLSGKEDPALKQSQTELNRQSAWESTSSLASEAATLASSATAPKVQDALNQISTDLATQAVALGDGLPHESSDSSTTASDAPASVSSFILALNSSGDALLNSALTAEQAMGRVFAAAGTSQLLQAQSLSTAAGTTAPSSKFLPVQVDFAAPVAPECQSLLEPRPGVTIDSALRAAALGEQEAIYAYQVATTRLSEPRFSSSAALLARHESKLKVLNEELKVRCLPQAQASAGYTLDDQFTTTPAPALATLESELARLYADLAGLSAAPATETTDAPAPQAGTDGKTPSNITELRKISVSWLLDSTFTQSLWGGSVNALSGLPAS